MFRGAVRGDLPQILKIYAHARAVMKASGNPTQWGDNFPPQELLEEDIDSNRLFLYVVNGQIEAVFAFILGADPTYAAIEDGQWLDAALWHGAPSGIGRKAQGRGIGSAGLEHGALPEPACRYPRRQQDHAASAGKERLYPLRCHPCEGRLPTLCLPEKGNAPAAGIRNTECLCPVIANRLHRHFCVLGKFFKAVQWKGVRFCIQDKAISLEKQIW